MNIENTAQWTKHICMAAIPAKVEYDFWWLLMNPGYISKDGTPQAAESVRPS